MTKIFLPLFFSLLLTAGYTYAQILVPEKACFPPVNWVSKSQNDTVTVQNGTGTPIIILINVNDTPNSGGININNCGETTHVKNGGSAVCATNDSENPVNFSSDSANPTSGNYQIKQA